MGFLSKKILRKLWGVNDPGIEMAAPIDSDDCRDARMAGKDACSVHHVHHPRAHTYHVGHEMNWGSGLSGSVESDFARDTRRASRDSIDIE